MVKVDVAGDAVLLAAHHQRRGVHVVYGLIGLKIHCKVALVVRREQDRIAHALIHLSTGNYNTVTAHLYTDIGLFTCDEAVADDVSDLFKLFDRLLRTRPII